MIILNEVEAGELAVASGLSPQKLKNGSFALPESVLTDEEHAARRQYLEGLPRRPVADDEFV